MLNRADIEYFHHDKVLLDRAAFEDFSGIDLVGAWEVGCVGDELGEFGRAKGRVNTKMGSGYYPGCDV